MKRPSSRAYKRLGTNIAAHTIMTAKLMSLYIVVTAASKAAVCALAHNLNAGSRKWPPTDRVATKLTLPVNPQMRPAVGLRPQPQSLPPLATGEL